MALPFAAARPVGSAVVVRGVQHSLLLSAAHQFDVWNVHNLLRDVYHVIASLDPAAGDGALPRRHAGAASYGVPPPCSVPLPYFVQSRDAARPLSTSSASASASASSTSARRRAGPAPNPYLARLTAQLAVSAGQSPHGRAGRMSRAQASILGRLSSRVSAAPSASEGARDTACTHGSSVRPRMTLRAAPQAAVAPWRDSAAAGASAGSSDGWSRASRFASARPGNSTRTSGRPTAHASHSRADNGQLSAPRSVTSSVREVRRLAAVRALSAEHVLSPERIVSVLGLALNLAQGRQRRLEVITLTIGGSVSGLGVVTLLTVSLRSGLNEATVRDMVDAWWLGRLAIAACAMVLGGTTALISLQPLPSQRRRIHALVLIFQCYLIAAVAFALAELTAEVRWLIARGARGEYDAVAIGVAIGHGYTLLVGGVLVAMTAAEHWRHRRELPHVLWLAHRLVWICLSGQALVELALVVCLARVGFFAQPDGAGLAVFAVLPPLVYAAGTAIACAPSFRERMRAALMVRLGALGALEALAPLAGYGSDRIERGVAAICAEALRDFRPVLLDEHALGALKAAWERAPCAVHEARSSASSRAGGSPSKRVAGGVGVRALSPLAAFDASLLAWSETQRADAYVVHAWADEPAGKLRALREYARAFAQKHGRPPAIWVDALCAVPHAAPARAAHALSAASRAPAMPWRPTAIARLSLKPAPIAPFELGVQGPHSPAVSPPRTIAAACGAQSAPRAAAVEPPRARSPTEGDGAAGAASARTSSPPRAFGTDEHASRQLEHLVLRIARSSQLLVLAGPSLFERLWCVVECYVWVTTGGSTERIALLPTTDEPADDAELLAAADTFHILYCDAAIVAHKWRLSLVAQTATVARMNSVMRALLNPLHAQLDLVARERRASEDAAGGAARGSRVEPLLHDEQGESDRAD
ncbi:hypothetical protein KFE25_003321 [Diacronema lutheri]|uniref:Uncharacterized protein n=1 Tax=Diacronema lutheri TaxID=2081491 RepID=A0A8J6CE72_DIALT|nr:hypothetical protein KFE25_003321 [Diacronema lutheri]